MGITYRIGGGSVNNYEINNSASVRPASAGVARSRAARSGCGLRRVGIWRRAAERRRRPRRPTDAVRKAVRKGCPPRSPCLAAALPHARPARIPHKTDPFRPSPIPRPRSSRSCRKMSPRTSPPQKSFARSARKRTPSSTFSSRACGESSPEIGAQINGGEGGIRTPVALVEQTRSPGAPNRPLWHLSALATESGPGWYRRRDLNPYAREGARF